MNLIGCCVDWNLITAITAIFISTIACIVAYITSRDTKKMTQLAIAESKLNNEIKLQITNCKLHFGKDIRYGNYVLMSLQIYNWQRTLYHPMVKMIIRKGREDYNFSFIPTETFAGHDYLDQYPTNFYRGMVLNVAFNFYTFKDPPFYERLKSLMAGEYQIEYKIYSQNIEVHSIIIKSNEITVFSFDAQAFEAKKPWERTPEDSLKQIRLTTYEFKENIFKYIEMFPDESKKPN